MRINNNLMAMNTHRQYGVNNSNVSKSVEKLSSGFRINRAGDDAAGLAISEKMRAQIRGLGMASRNSQDAISLIQTAEGALQESHNILQRMRELAVQSASDTNETTIDRDALNKEFMAMLDEIDDTATKTTFNDLGLIDGTFAKYSINKNPDGSSIVSPPLGVPAKVYADALTNAAADVTNSLVSPIEMSFNVVMPGDAPLAATPSQPVVPASNADTITGTGTDVGTPTFTAATKTTADAVTYTISATYGTDLTLTISGTDGSNQTVTVDAATLGAWAATNSATAAFSINIPDVGTVAFTDVDTTGTGTLNTAALLGAALVTYFDSGEVAFTGGTPAVLGNAAVDNSTGDTPIIAYSYLDAYGNPQQATAELFPGQSRVQLANGVCIDFGQPLTEPYAELATIFTGSPTTFEVEIAETGFEFVVQTGANKGDELNLNIDKMDSKTLGIFGCSVAVRKAASEAISMVNAAVNKVSSQRADLGALQNRMEHKIANLDTSTENLQAAESRIRDLDMAKEMTTFTKNNILSQAATAMLAQANSLPQGVLQLLQ